MVAIGVSGALGRMGQRIIAIAQADPAVKVVVGLEYSGHPQIGTEFNGIPIRDDCAHIEQCDCVIEFSSGQAIEQHLPALVEGKKAVVIGTTGLSPKQQQIIEDAAKRIPVVFTPNMSVGVNLFFKMNRLAASILKGYHVSIQETHHVHKKDAPSGTAKKIAQVINEQGFEIKTEDIKAVREDEIVGDHTVVFESDTDKIVLTHSAKTRDIFAQGAVYAAKWVVAKQPGLYSMEDVLFEQ